MNKKKLLFATIILATLVSCNTMQKDAKKVVVLMDKSSKQAQSLKLDKAEHSYLKARKIIDKYVEKEREAEFFEHVGAYRANKKDK